MQPCRLDNIARGIFVRTRLNQGTSGRTNRGRRLDVRLNAQVPQALREYVRGG